MRSPILISCLSLIATCTSLVSAIPSKNPGKGHEHEHENKPGKVEGKKPFVNTKQLMEQVYLSDLEEGAYVLQGISDRFNK